MAGGKSGRYREGLLIGFLVGIPLGVILLPAGMLVWQLIYGYLQ